MILDAIYFKILAVTRVIIFCVLRAWAPARLQCHQRRSIKICPDDEADFVRLLFGVCDCVSAGRPHKLAQTRTHQTTISAPRAINKNKARAVCEFIERFRSHGV